MGGRIVVQPNGQFARFSSNVDDFTHVGMSKEEAWNLCRDQGGSRYADEEIKRAENDPERFEDAIETIEIVHGGNIAEERREELSRESST